VPLVDPRTGLIDRAWYLFFLSLNRAVTGVIDESGVTFSAESTIASVEAELQALAQFAETLPPVVALPAPDALTDCCSGLVSQMAEMQKQIDALALLPAQVTAMLSQLADVSAMNPSDGDKLIYNGTTGKWEQDSRSYLMLE
tara:strand:+ start:619 stop:1044 length:426 start_codon:yes stop_codon:yes gene_type:complete